MLKNAVFSPCRTWRYALTRIWQRDEPVCMFVGLNPSTADETEDDPTIRRCIGFARDWGYGGLVMANIFAFRATDPRDMKAADDPVGPHNDMELIRLSKETDLAVAAWGVHGTHRDRDRVIRYLVPNMTVLGLTKDGHPKHPLYLKADLKPQAWSPLAVN